jgi:protoporphyrinogen oxidase
MSAVIIIGAGIAGLSAAYQLIENGCTDIVVLEKSDVLGGLSSSFTYNGFIFDLGPHQIHTEDQRVIDFLQEILKEDLIIAQKKASHWFLGKYLNYPLGISDILFGLPLKVSLGCFLDFCKQTLINLFVKKKVDSFESWVISHFGKKMYDIYFGPYTQKVWGKPPAQLAAICAQERIAVQNLFDVLMSAMTKNMAKFRNHYHLPHSPYQKVFYYPKYGIGQLANLMADYITRGGGKICPHAEVLKIVKDASGFSVVIKTGESFNGKQVISTMPIHELKEMLVNTPYDPVAKPNRKLEFRSMIFMFLEINRPTVTDNHWIYFPDRDCLFQRTSEFKNFSPAMCPEGKTSVCVEIPCDYKDDLWNMSNDELYGEVIEQSEKEHYLKRQWVDNYHVVKERYTYPTYDLSYAENLAKIRDYIDSFNGLYSIGRQGAFKYINIDEVMLMGFEAAQKIRHSS